VRGVQLGFKWIPQDEFGIAINIRFSARKVSYIGSAVFLLDFRLSFLILGFSGGAL